MNNICDFGAVGDGRAKDTAAIQRAIDADGMVFFPPGIYLSGTLYLKSRVGENADDGPGLIYAEFGAKNAPAAFHLTNVEKVRFRDVQIDWESDSPNWKHGIHGGEYRDRGNQFRMRFRQTGELR